MQIRLRHQKQLRNSKLIGSNPEAAPVSALGQIPPV